MILSEIGGGVLAQTVANQIFIIFLLIGLGFFIRKIKLINDGFTQGATNLIIYVTLPAMVLASMDRDFTRELALNGLIIFLLGGLMYAILSIIAFIFVKVRKINDDSKGVYLYMIIFGNVGYLGYPIMSIAFGEIGVFYAAFFNIWFNILTWTLGVKLMSKDRVSITKLLLNPGLLATLLGVVIFFLSIDLPSTVKTTLEMIGNTTVPLAMFVIGAFLADAKFSSTVKNKELYMASLMKLIAGPLLMVIILFSVELSSTIKAIPIVMSGMPSGVNTAIFARMFNRDYKLASQGVVLSTALSLITLPLLLMIIL